MADITLPQLGESVTEGTLGKWLKQVGDSVAKYEPLVEVVTDKVTAEVPSDYDGVLTEITVQEGETVSVGTVICKVSAEGAGADASAAAATGDAGAQARSAESPVSPTDAAESDRQSAQTPNESAVLKTADAAEMAGTSTSQDGPQSARYSPAVMRLAQENDIDLSQLQGTGAGGRITRKDVRGYVEDRNSGKLQKPADTPSKAGSVIAGTAETQPAREKAPVSESASLTDEIVEPSTVRKMIAKKMVESKHTAPHAWTVVEADVSNLAGLRQKVKSDFKRKEGIDLTYLPFFIKAVAEALKQYPMLNAAWVDEKIHMRSHVNISIAVATDEALVVPVIHDADRQSIAGLAHSVNQLAAKARSGRLSVDDVQGGTFTVNNTGAFGSVLSQPIINMPQSGILSVESIVKKPVVVNDAIAIRSMVNLCLSLDHRLLDGWISGQFLKAVKDRLQMYDENTMIY